eukprot:5413722-Amphidinium_carterae.1
MIALTTFAGCGSSGPGLQPYSEALAHTHSYAVDNVDNSSCRHGVTYDAPCALCRKCCKF